MNIKISLSVLCFILSIQSVWASCIRGKAGSFENAETVYLARVEAVNPVAFNELKNSTSAQIKVIKIYKAKDIEAVKQINKLTAFDKYSPILFTVGEQYLLYNEPAIGPCSKFDNEKIRPDTVLLFEKQHQPIWAAPKSY